MLKKLFYASASILMLALAYHLGATAAHGQSANAVVGNLASGYLEFVLTASGDEYVLNTNNPGIGWHFYENVGASAGRPASQFTVFAWGDGAYAFTANGDVYKRPNLDGPYSWAFINNVFGSSTPTARPSFGQLKAQYRK
jgi:hypothetical protein